MDRWQETYAKAGHDLKSLFEHPYKCKDCGSYQIDLSEDLCYGEMRKCKKRG